MSKPFPPGYWVNVYLSVYYQTLKNTPCNKGAGVWRGILSKMSEFPSTISNLKIPRTIEALLTALVNSCSSRPRKSPGDYKTGPLSHQARGAPP